MTIIGNSDFISRACPDWLDVYLVKIGCRCDEAANGLAGLSTLMWNHISTFSFEMLDFFVGAEPTIELDSVIEKFLYNNRGGGCSQQNGLFSMVLNRLGFSCDFGMARVPREDGAKSPRGHMFLFINLSGKRWLCDVGYGLGGPLQPILIKTDLVQQSGMSQFRIEYINDEFMALQRLSQGAWKTLYLFDQRTYDLSDFEPANYFNSLSPRSLFTKNLIVSRPTQAGGFLIRNRKFSYLENGIVRHEKIWSLNHLVELLEVNFFIRLTGNDFVNLPKCYL